MNKELFYQSVVKGEASKKGDMLYYGFIEHVKRDVMEEPAKFNAYMQGCMTKIDKFIASLPDDLEASQPLERLEVFDAESDIGADILVMWRIPVHEKTSNPALIL
jgi:hypothetical protein